MLTWRVLLPALGLVLSCGAGSRALEPPRTLRACVPASLLALEPGDAGLAQEVRDARSHETPSGVLEAGEALWNELVTEAASVLHSPHEGDADAARAFLGRWVYREPPLVVVDIDAFRLVPSAGAVFIEAATDVGDVDALRLWLNRTAIEQRARDAALACIEELSLRGRDGTAASP